MKRLVLAVAIAMFAATPAFAYHCPAEMAQIDAALAKKPSMPADQLAEVKSLRAEGEALHKAGDHDRSLKVLGEAKQMLGLE